MWLWDIIKLCGLVKWSYYYLYVIFDIFFCYVVGWMVVLCELKVLVEWLIV